MWMEAFLNFLKDPVNGIANWLHDLLTGWGLAADAATIIIQLLGAFVVCMAALLMVVLLIWVERKLYARIQDRLGPNRVGPWGILQTIPDMVKIFTKEYITPDGADKVPYNLAPILAVSAVLLIWAVLPLAPTIYGSNIDVGILYIVAVGAIGTLGIILAGWASNNKYALIGAFRTVSQMVAYEVPMVLALLVPVLLARTMGVNSLVQAQSVWFILVAPVAALIFLITSQAELGRAPFDLLEAESEIVAGFQVEYSGLKFGMFFVGEFLHAFTVSLLMATLFLGGWRGPFAEQWPILGTVYLFLKAAIVYFVVVLMRIALPRFRIDQMLNFTWKVLTPLALVLLMLTAVTEKILSNAGWGLTSNTVPYILVHLAVNALIFAGLWWLAGKAESTHEVPVVGSPRPTAVPPKKPVADAAQDGAVS
jgi:NADH-quinone oxidoreductase subunit H